VQTDAGLLFVVHQALDLNGRRGYSHRFLLLDDDYAITAMSAPFSLSQPGVEFCAGLARHNGAFLLTFGIGDCSAELGIAAADEVFSALESPT
jgi:hypothetical protein